MPLAPHDVIPALISGGVVSAQEAVHAGISVHSVGRSHPMFRIEIGGLSRAFLKSFGPRRGATDGTAAQERAVLALAAERPDVAAIVPQALAWHGEPDIIVTEALVGHAAWSDEEEGGDQGQAWSELVERVAAPLARFHRATRHLAAPDGAPPPDAFAPVEPWGLKLGSGDAPPEIWEAAPLAPAMMRLASDPALSQGLRFARQCWRNLCLIHADLKHDNIILIDGNEGARIAIVDWEMARIGDPAWDLAGLALRLPITALGDDPWNGQTIERIAALLGAYVSASGLPAPPLAQRLPGYMATWLVMSAIQHQSTQNPDQPDDGAEELLTKAHDGFVRREALVSGLIGALA